LVQAGPAPGEVLSPQSGIVCVQGYKVKNVYAPILEAILTKHGDVASACVFTDAAMRRSLLEAVCDIVRRIETNDVTNIMSSIKEIESQLHLVQAGPAPGEVLSPQSGIICVQGYKVKKVYEPILEAILTKHGDVASVCVFTDAAMRRSLLEAVCDIVRRIETYDVTNIMSSIKEIESQLHVAKAAKIKVSWLQDHSEAIRKSYEAEKKATMLMELQTNTILVERAARSDLKERHAKLVAAQNEFAEAESRKCLGSSVLVNSEDRWFWDLNGNGVFCVKDVRKLLDEPFLPKEATTTRWVKFVPIKINVFAWKVTLDRLPTRVNLMHRGIYVSSLSCPICSSHIEDTLHLLFSCTMAADVTRLVCHWWDLVWSHLGSSSEWLSWFNSIRLGSNLKSALEEVFFVTWWCLWNFRNRLLFAAQKSRKDVIFDDVVARFLVGVMLDVEVLFLGIVGSNIFF
nr:RNA-directed DNA polymerase, eukaryota [Tanacetum cinerariifolium]